MIDKSNRKEVIETLAYLAEQRLIDHRAGKTQSVE